MAAVNSHIRQFQLSIDHALAISYRRSLYDAKTLFVAHISLVKGVPFYGYHVGYQVFLKIYMLNPLYMTRLADILRQGAIMKKVIQPYESHMQYLAQWMCDFNLYGCAYIVCSEVKFRNPVPEYSEMNSTHHRWHDRSIDSLCISDQSKLPRQSHCSIEVDVCTQHILNRLDVKPRPIHHDFIEWKDPVEVSEKLVQSMAGLWRDETRRRKARMGEVDSEGSPFPPEVLVSVSADPRNSQPGGWIHEKEYAAKIEGIMEHEREKSDGREIGIDNFIRETTFESQVKTSLESVEDLFPENLARVTLSDHPSQITNHEARDQNVEEPETDESHLLFYEEDDLPYESDEELARELERSKDKRRKYGDVQLEQFPNDGLNEPVYHYKDASARDNLCGKGVDVHKLQSSEEPPIPNSSTELEAIGIRHLGDHDHFDEDAFEIPTEFTSNIGTEISKGSESSDARHKKRKTNHVERLEGGYLEEHPADSHISTPLQSSADDLSNSNSTSDQDDHRAPRFTHSSKRHQRHRDDQWNYRTLSSSQGKTARNKTLTFPVVKDPQDPNTILKLSQSTGSPLKNTQTANPKSVSSEIPSALDHDSSKWQKSASSISAESPKVMSSQVVWCSSQIHRTFDIPTAAKVLCVQEIPPSSPDVLQQFQSARLPSTIYQEAYYSDEKDVPDRAREYAGREYKIESSSVPFLPNFDSTGKSPASLGKKPGVVVDKLSSENESARRRRACSLRIWEIESSPPTREEVQAWLSEIKGQASQDCGPKKDDEVSMKKAGPSQLEGPTQKNRHGFKYSQKQKSTSVQHETQYMSLMGLEIHVNTRGNLVPSPEQDQIECVFWCLQSDDEDLEVNGVNEGTHVGVLVLSETRGLTEQISQYSTLQIEEETSELDLIIRIVDIVRSYDPDILTGYEVHGASWGYMIERARCKYDYNLCDELSRTKTQSHGRFGKEDDRWGFNHTSTIRVTGRHMINIWRAMRGELNLLQYTMENVVFQLCHRRIPHYSFQDLTSWYRSNNLKDLIKVVDYYVSRVQLDLEILEQNELVPRTSEQARLLGVDFYSVFSRGSQFKVESLMFRIAKPENYLLPSPSRKQVGQQNALECLPLVMEPQSAFYNSPLLVLDFQSLYPSVMIAYNYCYSTFLGRVVSWRGQNKMGFSDYERELRMLEVLKDKINIAPNGIMYAKPEIRKSLLAKMLGEILETRVMVKSGMKVDKDDKTLQRLLNNRQLALKLIANVTYGYTSASFSGRMPCSEIADSIVQTGRETLEKAIALIHSVERWGAEVVYGDTDSLFVYLKGRTKDEAFDIGGEIAKSITDMNPRPVKLKFEKVYFPCVLLAKKRYVGYKYESKTQEVPDFDAKGIETVRRDGTPAEQKIEEKALKILFRTADLSEVKSYFQKQCTKIMRGKVSIQDFCFAKEVKLGTYSDRGLPPPGALISTKRMLEDPRAEPQYGERVPYVVITGGPGARLIDRCVAPEDLLSNDYNELDAEYYISKNLIPPLERIFNLVGANVRQWYDEMPKHQRIRRIEAASLTNDKDTIISKKTLESYMNSSTCLVCHEKLEEESIICARCLQHADSSILLLRKQLNRAEKKAISLDKICRSCAGLPWGEDIRCDSKDCPVFYSRTRHLAELRSSRTLSNPILGILQQLDAPTLSW